MPSVTIPGFSGTVISPDEAGYDAARAIWNAMHDRRPALIARPQSAQDVAAAVRYARAGGLPIAVRGGGHSMPGHSVCDDGIVIDLRALNQVRVDPQARRAKIGGGTLLVNIPATWRDAADDEREIAWARATFAAGKPYLSEGNYINFMGDDEDDTAAAAYGRTIERLRQIKAVYDPANVFRLNQNIKPAASAA